MPYSTAPVFMDIFESDLHPTRSGQPRTKRLNFIDRLDYAAIPVAPKYVLTFQKSALAAEYL